MLKVCKNCLQILNDERKKNGFSTCADCSKKIAAAQQKNREVSASPPLSNLAAALKHDLLKQEQEQAQLKQDKEKQKNVEHFYDDFQKVKRGF